MEDKPLRKFLKLVLFAKLYKEKQLYLQKWQNYLILEYLVIIVLRMWGQIILDRCKVKVQLKGIQLTRVLHLELTLDESTHALILALRLFIQGEIM